MSALVRWLCWLLAVAVVLGALSLVAALVRAVL